MVTGAGAVEVVAMVVEVVLATVVEVTGMVLMDEPETGGAPG